uniref:Fibronectin type-III domain-containing protein n=1 Tax=Eptatretus burgeri TaxID=7764 RepID=A0A8C4N3Z2_EPTBU
MACITRGRQGDDLAIMDDDLDLAMYVSAALSSLRGWNLHLDRLLFMIIMVKQLGFMSTEILCLFSFLIPNGCATAGDPFDRGTIQPSPIYTEFGGMLHATCNVTAEQMVIKCKPLRFVWMLQGVKLSELHSSPIPESPHAAELMMPGWKGTSEVLVCHLNCNDEFYPINRAVVIGGYPPEPATNLSCRLFPNINSDMNCTWVSGRNTLLPTHFVFYIYSDQSNLSSDCGENATSCIIPRKHLAVFSIQKIWVKATNKLGTVNSTKAFIDPSQLVQTYPPSITSLKWRDKLTTNAILKWDPPKEAGSDLHLLYQVEYRRGFDAWVTLPDRFVWENGNYALLPELQECCHYEGRVRTRIFDLNIYWSDWAQYNWTVPETVPPSQDLWMRFLPNCKEEQRCVMLLFKPREKKLCPSSVNLCHVKIISLSPDEPPQNLSHVKCDNKSMLLTLGPSAYRIVLFASNKYVSSPRTTLHVPSAPLPVRKFPSDLKVTGSDGKVLAVSWKAISVGQSVPLISYVVDWCRCDEDMNNCSGGWIRTRGLNVTIREGILEFVCYRVIVTAEYKDGSLATSSALGYVRQAAPKSSATLKLHKISATWALIRWKNIPLQDRRGFLTNLSLYYQMNNGGEEMMKTVNPGLHEVQLNNLQRGSTYEAWMVAETIAGKGPRGNPLIFQTPLYLFEEHFGFSVLGLCLITGIIICCAFSWRWTKSWLRGLPDVSRSSLSSWFGEILQNKTLSPTRSSLSDKPIFTDTDSITAVPVETVSTPFITDLDNMCKEGVRKEPLEIVGGNEDDGSLNSSAVGAVCSAPDPEPQISREVIVDHYAPISFAPTTNYLPLDKAVSDVLATEVAEVPATKVNGYFRVSRQGPLSIPGADENEDIECDLWASEPQGKGCSMGEQQATDISHLLPPNINLCSLDTFVPQCNSLTDLQRMMNSSRKLLT